MTEKPYGLEQNTPYIVTIFSSHEEMDALDKIFRYSNAEANIVFIIIRPTEPHPKKISTAQWKQGLFLPILPLKNGQPVLANHVYFLPKGENINLDRQMQVTIDKASPTDKHDPLRFFLCGLACAHGKKVISILLSETDQDITGELQCLRAEGGLVIAQSGKKAIDNNMLQRPLDSGLVDYIMSPDSMHAFLLIYIEHLNDPSVHLPASVSDEFKKILSLVKAQTGYDFLLYKPNTIFRRIQKRMDILQLNMISHYVHYLHQYPAEITTLFKGFLINVTHFFRDKDAFDVLKVELLSRLSSGDFSQTGFRVWVSACATGEEAYSIAILIKECMNALNLQFNVHIFATDIDVDALDKARAGIFPAKIERHVSLERLERFFTKEGDEYKIQPDIRKMIIFAVQNIIVDPPFTKLNLISCRNLLIYLKGELQKKILPLFQYSLHPQGLLFMGPSENMGSFIEFFNTVDSRWKLYERKNGEAASQSDIGLSSRNQLSDNYGVKMTRKAMCETEPTLSSLVKNILTNHYTPAFIVIDEKGDIVYIYGRTSKYLEFAFGEVQLHFMDMVRSELKLNLHVAIRKARDQQTEVVLNGLHLPQDHGLTYINVKIRPLNEVQYTQRKLLLIIIEEVATLLQSPLDVMSLNGKSESEVKIVQLEHELSYTRVKLQTTIEELETSNEELKSSNEELQSTNEELHSLNEELTTVNAELGSRIEQLSSANDDIKNLLDATGIATVFLDRDLCVKRFTPKATEIIHLIPSDMGRPVNHIVSNLNYQSFLDNARTVMKTLETMSTEVLDKSGQWFKIKIIPYRTLTNLIEGVIITFSNIDDKKIAEMVSKTMQGDVVQLESFIHQLLNKTVYPSIVLDNQAQVVLANDAFLTQFQYAHKDMAERSIYQLKMAWDKQALRKIIEKPSEDNAPILVSTLSIADEKTIQVTLQRLSSTRRLFSLNV